MNGKINFEKGKKENVKFMTISDFLIKGNSYIKLVLFLISIPLTLITFFIFIGSFVLKWYFNIPLGVSIGLIFTVLYIDKLLKVLK